MMQEQTAAMLESTMRCTADGNYGTVCIACVSTREDCERSGRYKGNFMACSVFIFCELYVRVLRCDGFLLESTRKNIAKVWNMGETFYLSMNFTPITSDISYSLPTL